MAPLWSYYQLSHIQWTLRSPFGHSIPSKTLTWKAELSSSTRTTSGIWVPTLKVWDLSFSDCLLASWWWARRLKFVKLWHFMDSGPSLRTWMEFGSPITIMTMFFRNLDFTQCLMNFIGTYKCMLKGLCVWTWGNANFFLFCNKVGKLIN